jgi:hypothetical protein
VDLLWLVQAVIAIGCVLGFAVEGRRAFAVLAEHRGSALAEAMVVVGFGLIVIALANVLTALATSLELGGSVGPWGDLRQIGGTAVRGVLVTLVLYLVIRRPLRPPR